MNVHKIDIIMPVFNRYNVTINTIMALNTYRYPSIRLTVVDNGSEDILQKELIGLYKKNIIDRLILLGQNFGVSCACNIGWEYSDRPFFMKLDNDIEIISPTWLEDIFSMWANNRYKTLFSPIWNCTKKIGRHETTSGIFWDIPYSFSGQALLVSSKIHKQIGFFNEDYGLYGEEDADYCLRCHHAGIKTYCYEANSMLKENGTEDFMYIEKGVDKKKLHESNVQLEQSGIFAFNLFLYKNNLRPLNVLRKYTITSVKDIHVTLGENPDYKQFHEKILAALDVYKSNCNDDSNSVDLIKIIKNILQ